MNPLDAPVLDAAWAAIDFEGTGTAPGQSDEAVQVGVAVMAPGFAPPSRFFRSYVRPEGRLTRPASAVHRITERDVADAPLLGDLWPEIRSRLCGAVVVAHGAGTEKRFLRAFPLHGFGPWIDTLTLSRSLLPRLSDHSLSAVVAECRLERPLRSLCPDLDWHDALFDALACLVLLRHFVEEFNLARCVVGQLVAAETRSYHRTRRAVRLARDSGLGGRDVEC